MLSREAFFSRSPRATGRSGALSALSVGGDLWYGGAPPRAETPMQPGGYPAQQFPPTLEGVPTEGQLVETFAFIPGALALGGVLSLIGSFVYIGKHQFREMGDLVWPAGCFFGAVIFGAWEIWRRMGRTTVLFWGDQIGLYRGGKLQQTAYRSQIQIYQLNILNTIRELIGFGFFALVGLFVGLAALGSDLGTGLSFIGGAIGLISAFISSIYARVACRHFFVPKGRGTEQVMFTRGQATRFGL